MTTPASAPAPAPKKTPSASTTAAESPIVTKRKGVSRGTDIALTIVFLFLNALMLPVLFVITFMLGISGGYNPDLEVLGSVGAPIASFGPSVAFIVNLVISINFLGQKRMAWLLSLLLGVGGLLVFLIGAAMIVLSKS